MLPMSSRNPSRTGARVPVRPDTASPGTVRVRVVDHALDDCALTEGDRCECMTKYVRMPAPMPPVGNEYEVTARLLPDARAAFVSTLSETGDRARARAAAANTFHDTVRDWAVDFLDRYPCRAAGDFVRDVLREGSATITHWGR